MSRDFKFGWLPDKPDHRDYVYHRKLSPQKLPVKVDLTAQYQVPVVDQGDLGSCTGNGIASALAYLQEKEGAAMVYPSRLFIYYNERVIEGTVQQDAGAEIRDGIKSVAEQGFCPEVDWPYEIQSFAVRPDPTAYADALKDLVKSYQRVPVDSASIMTALSQGFPVIVGFTVYNSFPFDGDGTVNMPLSGEAEAGGHCVIVVGYDQDSQRFKFQNSWGTGWGTNGFGTIPFTYLGDSNYGGDYWIVTADQSVPQPQPVPNPTPQPSTGCLSRLLPKFLVAKISKTT